MIYSIFGSNRTVVLGLLALPALAFGSFALFYTGRPPMPLGGFVFDWLNALISLPLLQILAGVVVNLIGAVLINHLYNAHDYADRENYFPALFYLLFTSLQLSWQYFNPVLAGNVFLLLALRRLLRMYRVQEITGMIYDAGVFLGIAALFYPPFIIAFPLLWISLIQLRTFNIREWLVPITGLLTPLIYAALFYWWFEINLDLPEYFQLMPLHFKSLISAHSFFFYILLLFSLFVFFAGFLIFIREMGISTVHKKNTKKVFISLTFILCLMWVASLALNEDQTGLSCLLAVPISVYGGVLFSRARRRRKLLTTIFYIWILLLVFYPIFTEVF